MTGQFLQALGDQRGGLGDITAAFRDPRAQEGELWPGKRGAHGEPVQQLILGGPSADELWDQIGREALD